MYNFVQTSCTVNKKVIFYKRAGDHLTAECLVAPLDCDALLSAVSAVGSEDGAVT